MSSFYTKKVDKVYYKLQSTRQLGADGGAMENQDEWKFWVNGNFGIPPHPPAGSGRPESTPPLLVQPVNNPLVSVTSVM